MFRFLCTRRTTVILARDFALINSTARVGLVESTFFIAKLCSSSLHIDQRSVEAKNNGREQKQKSFVVSYLKNSCGLSLESAISVAKKVNFNNTEKVDSVLRLLRDRGLSNTQISRVIRVHPGVILLDSEKIILPKMEFLRSIGFSGSDLAKLISQGPSLLTLSLKNRLIPNYNFLKNVLILDEKVVAALKRNIRLFFVDVSSNLTPNIAFLRKIGVPQSQIPHCLIRCPAAAICNHSKFCNIVNEVKEMGSNPVKMTFVVAIQVMYQMKKANWEHKIEVYRRWGWSKDETLAAFIRQPHSMLISEEKITKTMDFLVNKMGWLSQDIAKVSTVLLYSMEKRIVPRCSVVQVLLSKGLIREDISPVTFLVPRESEFMDKYVTKFQDKIPQLLNLYRGEINPLDVSSGFQRYAK